MNQIDLEDRNWEWPTEEEKREMDLARDTEDWNGSFSEDQEAPE